MRGGGGRGAGTVEGRTPGGGGLLLEAADLDRLHGALRDAGYRVIGPTVRGGAIVLAELAGRRHPVEPADAHVHRVNRPPADRFHDRVSDPAEGQAALHDLPVITG